MCEISLKSPEGQIMATEAVKTLALEIFKLLDDDGQGMLDWCEFKGYGQVDTEKQAEIMEYIKKSIDW